LFFVDIGSEMIVCGRPELAGAPGGGLAPTLAVDQKAGKSRIVTQPSMRPSIGWIGGAIFVPQISGSREHEGLQHLEALLAAPWAPIQPPAWCGQSKARGGRYWSEAIRKS
jgi:hypothetical protein